ncbi:MAG: cation:proton antiporter [Bacillota bacterium]
MKIAGDLETIISMMHLPTLITDLGIILVIAALVTLLFKKMGQPLVLGYLIAGFLVSQHFPWLPTIQDKESISIWAEIGVIFLLFGLGLEFSFKKLVKVGGSAGFTAVFEVLVMVGIGYIVGRLLGWNNIDSIFLGGILSVSSTTIIVRAFQELNMKGNRFVDLVFGILVVEDIVAVLLLVLLPSLVVGEAISVGSLLGVSLRMIFFVLLWFILGIFLLPAFLRKIRDLLEEETTLIVAIGLCLVMVVIASAAGFSPALGAFVMGSLLAETPEGHHIEKLLNPVKNLFAAVFFVSVGTMIDPKVIMQHPGLIFIITVVTIFGKFFSTYLGALLSGQSRKTSMQAGMSLAQIGEFSFIIASLGVSLKVTSDFLYPLAVAASAVTTFTTPYLIKSSEWAFEKTDHYFPERLKNALDRYKASFQRQGSRSVGALVMSTYGLKILLNSVVILAIILAIKFFVSQYLAQVFLGNANLGILTFIFCLVLSAPFFWGLVKGRPSRTAAQDISDLAKLRGLNAGIAFGRIVLALVLLSVMVAQFVSFKIASGALIGVIVFMIVFTSRYGERFYKFFEDEFLGNLTEKEKEDLRKTEVQHHLQLPWDAAVSVFELPLESGLVGKSLRDLAFKENWGVTIASVIRGERRFFAPSGDFVLWPFDKIACFGSETELNDLHEKLEKDREEHRWISKEIPRYRTSSFEVDDQSPLKGLSIQQSGVRERDKVLIVGLERQGEKILGPSAATVLQVGDLVWVVSE